MSDSNQHSIAAALDIALDHMGVPRSMPKSRDWCDWCSGRGCIACAEKRRQLDAEYKRHVPNGPQPIFTADINDPAQVEEAKTVIGKEALEKAFGPGGGGVEEIERKCAEVMAKRKPST